MTTTGFAPTHTIPDGGLDAWAAPDATVAAVARLDAGLDVQLLKRQGDWAQIRCSNDWEAWTDGRLLVAGESPRIDEAVSALVEALRVAADAYKTLLDAFDSGEIDEATLRQRALGIGLVVKEDGAWMLDLVNGKWHHFDGFQLRSLDLTEES